MKYVARRTGSVFAGVSMVAGLALASVAGQPAAPAHAAERAQMPAGLAGNWKYGTINPTVYFDKGTGAYQGHGGGAGMYYTFDKSGKYQMLVHIQTRNYGWEMKVWTLEEGTVAVRGDEITLTPTSGRYRSEDNRVQKNNFERPMTAAELKKNAKTYEWAVGQKDGKVQLVLSSEKDGKRSDMTLQSEKESIFGKSK